MLDRGGINTACSNALKIPQETLRNVSCTRSEEQLMIVLLRPIMGCGEEVRSKISKPSSNLRILETIENMGMRTQDGEFQRTLEEDGSALALAKFQGQLLVIALSLWRKRDTLSATN
uniref:Uncharacterized protein n=1 Tax=Ascaris lumbricoides TaxID=6252 RepID=A0A0M3I2X9_ASCLU